MFLLLVSVAKQQWRRPRTVSSAATWSTHGNAGFSSLWLTARGVRRVSDFNPLIAVFRPGKSLLHVKEAAANDELMTQRWQGAFVNPISRLESGCLVIRSIKLCTAWMSGLPSASYVTTLIKGEKLCSKSVWHKLFCQAGSVSRTGFLFKELREINWSVCRKVKGGRQCLCLVC